MKLSEYVEALKGDELTFNHSYEAEDLGLSANISNN